MATHHRVIFPVGHGGFAFESIGDTNVIFDCGSDTAPSRVEMYIDLLKAHGVTHIDYLFISHFDKDHVNTLDYLLKQLNVKNVVMCAIPDDFQYVYDAALGGAYLATINIVNQHECEIINVGDEAKPFVNPLWEWIAHSMLTVADLQQLQIEMQKLGINIQSLNNPMSVTQNRNTINRAVKNAFGPLGPNSKGLVVLSQKIVTATVDNIDLWKDRFLYRLVRGVMGNFDATDCLYVGDANLSSAINVKEVQDFITKCKAQQPMLLMQIPHHGSRRNMRDTFNMDFPSKYYFVNDINRTRIRKKMIVYQALKRKKQLLVVRESCRDLIFGRIEVH